MNFEPWKSANSNPECIISLSVLGPSKEFHEKPEKFRILWPITWDIDIS